MLKLKLTTITAAAVLLSACASTGHYAKPIEQQALNSAEATNAPMRFSITGKIGITTRSADGSNQGGSAFYGWSQDAERFSIDLTGALGLGATQIRYNGQTATLMSERTGLISAASPEELLTTATGWHAPISQLPYWIMGKSAPDDSERMTDKSNRLTDAKNGDWTAVFEYGQARTPERLRITHTDGHRVVMTINH